MKANPTEQETKIFEAAHLFRQALKHLCDRDLDPSGMAWGKRSDNQTSRLEKARYQERHDALAGMGVTVSARDCGDTVKARGESSQS